jgi:hypothetical protein
MSKERVNGLGQIAREREIALSLDIGKFTAIFAARMANKIKI